MEMGGRRPMTDWEAVVLRPGRFVVPLERENEFTELLGRAQEIYERHALNWWVLRSREDPTVWREFGHRFREEADLRAAREELEKAPSILDGLNEFETGYPDAWGAIEGYMSTEWETVFEVGERRVGNRRLPPIPPEKMTDAMRKAQALARALAPRVAKIAPPGYKVWADQEIVYIEEPEGGRARECSLVDFGAEEMVLSVLGDLADDATEELTVPWPHDPAQGYKEHDPEVEVRDGAIHAWYGSRQAPVLSIEPIPLSELED
jgi:hypothetical protein